MVKRKMKNVEDAVMKSILDVFKEDALKFFGIDSKIITAARTELKDLQINTSFMDYTFLLDDGSFIHFEFQTTKNRQDLSRFLAYDAVLHYKENRHVNTIVVYSSGIKNAKTSIDLGSIKYSVQAFYMDRIDGDEQYEHLKNKIDQGEALTRLDLLALVFLPIMHSEKDKNERIIESIKLAKEIKDKENQMNSLALLYAFSEKFIDDKNIDKVKEVFRMTELGKLLKEEGIEEGRKRELVRTSIRLLTKKFGILPEDVKEKLEKAEITELEIIVDSILDFNKLEEVNKYLK
ncbi:hypothetical protein CLTEP_11470 [Clostridium tepidiprofundi DSM 19306]|uniref:DUF4351 domain-containing protein n=1 Tax=Clostridium tepidiprofundi DSM 19306 TaxID=1121338 RepID=A0A151B4Z6_9CLOT|nr:DUF4351 domain-containing protein [Clostridium tepidiprofundi]KYH34832.1 hypothetical protein CLTEP_11470 [Clostridium tepidiprofundi DSM 19306]